ncbi:hypothetical protein [Sphingomonas sp. UYP23]
MSNRTALTRAVTELDAIDTNLRAAEQVVMSLEAAVRVVRARAYVVGAKLELAAALRTSVDPILDLTCGAVS